MNMTLRCEVEHYSVFEYLFEPLDLDQRAAGAEAAFGDLVEHAHDKVEPLITRRFE